jgi:hypothetical protein
MVFAAFLVSPVLVTRASAQAVLSEPLVFGAGRVTLGGEASVTFSCGTPAPGETCGHDTGFFNYSDYDLYTHESDGRLPQEDVTKHSTLRMVRLGVSASVAANRHMTVLAEIRSDNAHMPRPYALYLRVRPWQRRPLDFQLGRVPPTFGGFARRTYAGDNLLIGYPLAYQYLTSLRADAVPASADELLGMRGRGWLSRFTVGNPVADRGLPIVTAFHWDTGAQVHTSTAWADATMSVTLGSLANPLVKDDNAGKQVAGRVALRPTPGIVIGVSGARGPFLTRGAALGITPSGEEGRFVQTAFGADVEYSRDYYLVRAEAIANSWTIPTIGSPLRTYATFVEGRYKFHPRWYAAARFDHLNFGTIEGATRTAPWDAPVTRVEVGAGYVVRRNLTVKASWQHNAREWRPGDGSRVVPEVNLGAVQMGFSF